MVEPDRSLDIVPEALASTRSENEGKGEKELSLLDNTLICVENPEHTYKLEEQVTAELPNGSFYNM